MNFKNKTAISTGAASGMGLLLAQNWAELGGNVVMCDVNEKVLNEKVEEINLKGKGKAVGVLCDVRDYKQVCGARDKAVAEFGSIDVVANFAGGTAVRIKKVDREKYPEFPDVPINVYDWGIDVNLKGPFYFAHAVLKQMREQKSGLIISRRIGTAFNVLFMVFLALLADNLIAFSCTSIIAAMCIHSVCSAFLVPISVTRAMECSNEKAGILAASIVVFRNSIMSICISVGAAFTGTQALIYELLLVSTCVLLLLFIRRFIPDR